MEYLADTARPLGATLTRDGCRFCVWAPKAQQVQVRIVGGAERLFPMTPDGTGYWQAEAPGVGAGDRYFYRLDGGVDRPDPASRLQPEGVHGPSEVVDPAFGWTDRGWRGLPLQEYYPVRASRRDVHPRRHVRRSHREAALPRGPGRHGHRDHARGPVSRHAQLGLRRGAGLRGPELVRRTGRAAPPGGRGARGRARRRPRRRVQPLGPGGQLSRRFRALFYRALPERVGRGRELRRAGQRRGAPLLRRERARTGCASSTSTGCGSTRSTPCSTSRPARSSRSWRGR